MICSICEEVSQVPTGTRIPTASTNMLWARKLDSGRRVSLICRRRAARLSPTRIATVEESECLVRRRSRSWDRSTSDLPRDLEFSMPAVFLNEQKIF